MRALACGVFAVGPAQCAHSSAYRSRVHPEGLIWRGRGGGGGQKCVYQNWPDKIFSTLNFRFFPRWSLGLEGGGGYPRDVLEGGRGGA